MGRRPIVLTLTMASYRYPTKHTQSSEWAEWLGSVYTAPQNYLYISILGPGLKLVSLCLGVYGKLPPWANIGRAVLDPVASHLWTWDLHLPGSKQFPLQQPLVVPLLTCWALVNDPVPVFCSCSMPHASASPGGRLVMVSQPWKSTGYTVYAHRTISVCTRGESCGILRTLDGTRRGRSNNSLVPKKFSDLLSTFNHELIEPPSTSNLAARGRGIVQCRGQRLTPSSRPVTDVLIIPQWFFKKWIWGVFRWGAWILQMASGPTTPYLAQLTYWRFQPHLKLSPGSRGRNISARILALLISQLCDLELVAYICFEPPLILFWKMKMRVPPF